MGFHPVECETSLLETFEYKRHQDRFCAAKYADQRKWGGRAGKPPWCTPLVTPSTTQQVWAILYCPGMLPWSASQPDAVLPGEGYKALSWQLLSYHRLCQQPSGSWHGPLCLAIEILICKEGYRRAIKANKINEERQVVDLCKRA